MSSRRSDSTPRAPWLTADNSSNTRLQYTRSLACTSLKRHLWGLEYLRTYRRKHRQLVVTWQASLKARNANTPRLEAGTLVFGACALSPCHTIFTSMALSAKDLILEYLKAYNARDIPAMLSLFHEACVFENISGGKATVRTEGKAELEVLARESAQAFAMRQQIVTSLLVDGRRAVAEVIFEAVLQSDLSPELKAGSRLNLRGVSIFEVAGGKVLRLTDYS